MGRKAPEGQEDARDICRDCYSVLFNQNAASQVEAIFGSSLSSDSEEDIGSKEHRGEKLFNYVQPTGVMSICILFGVTMLPLNTLTGRSSLLDPRVSSSSWVRKDINTNNKRWTKIERLARTMRLQIMRVNISASRIYATNHDELSPI